MGHLWYNSVYPALDLMNRWHVANYILLLLLNNWPPGDLTDALFSTFSPQHQGHLSLDLGHKRPGDLTETSCSQPPHSTNSLPSSTTLGTYGVLVLGKSQLVYNTSCKWSVEYSHFQILLLLVVFSHEDNFGLIFEISGPGFSGWSTDLNVLLGFKKKVKSRSLCL